MSGNFKRTLLMGMAFGAVAGAAPTLASAQAAQPAARGQAGVLEEVIVTAERRSQNVQNVPIAISAVSERMLAENQVTSTAQLMTLIPSLNITRANTASIPYLRGVGNFTAAPGNEAAIATYIDDVYYPSPAGSTYSYNNIARIEVLKGPQGTLFGRNAAGGVINIITKDPGPVPHIDFSAGYANYNTVTSNFYGTTPLGDTLSTNLAIYYQKQNDGWGTNLLNGRDVYLSQNFAIRNKVIFKPNADWSFRLITDYNKTRDDATATLNIVPGTISARGYTIPGGFHDVALDTYSEGNQEQYGVSLRADHYMSWANVAGIVSWRKNVGHALADLDASPARLVTFDNIPNQESTSQELQISSPTSSTIKWIGGIYLFQDDASLDPTIQQSAPFAALPQSTRVLYDSQKTESYAGYSQVTAPIFGPKTRVTAGLRYTSDTRQVYYSFQHVTGFVYNTGKPPAKTWPKITYRLSLDHDFTDNILGYVSYNRGFKSGNYNLNGPDGKPVVPEVLDAYEAGIKSDLFEKRVRFNASVFYYTFKDLQVQQSIVGGTIQSNAAASEYKGLDLDLTVVPTDALTLGASVAVLEATYTDFRNATFYFPCVTRTVAAACASTVGGGGYYTAIGDSTGLDIPYAERLVASVTANYLIRSDHGDVRLVGSVGYHDGFYFDVQNILRQPRNTIVDGSVMWTAPNKKIDVILWAKNLLDEDYYAQQQVNANGANYAPQAPRTFGFTVGYHWN